MRKRKPKNEQKWTSEEVEFLLENYKHLGVLGCAEKLNRREGSIRGKLSNLGIKRAKIYSKDQIKWLSENFPTKDLDECAQYLNCTLNSLRSLAQRNGFKRKRTDYGEEDINKFSLNDPYFVYLLGFLWADGHLGQQRNLLNCGTTIQEEDGKVLLDIFNKFKIFTTKYYKSKKVNKKDVVCFYTRNQTFCKLLYSYGYKNKSLISPDKLLNDIPRNIQHYWWRGFTDGDGHISIREQSCGNRWKTCKYALYGSYDQDWNFVKDLGENLGINFKYLQRIRDSGRASEVHIVTRKHIIIVGNYIYQNFENDGIGLYRKYIKFLEIIEYNKFRKEHPQSNTKIWAI
jgi:hypothetical protein